MELSLKEMGLHLKKLRENAGLSTREVYELSKVSNSYLSLVENGHRRASAIVLKKLAPVYKVDYLDLYEKAGYIDLIKKEKKESKNIINVYSAVHAGILTEMIEDIVDTEEIDESMLKGGKEYFGVKVKGDSMSPKYLDGDTIIVEKNANCENGQDCIVAVNGNEAFLKRVFKSETGIMLQALNPNYEPIIYNNEDIKDIPVTIIGIVRELRRKI